MEMDSSEAAPSGYAPQAAPHSPWSVGDAWRAARASAGNALIAATGGIVLMLLARALFQIATPAELLGDRLTALIPLGVFSALLNFFGHNAKHFYFGGLLVAQGVATAALASLYWAARTTWTVRLRQGGGASASATTLPPAWWDVLVFGALFWLVSTGIVAPLIGAGLLGNGVNGGALALLEAEAIPALGTAALFVWLAGRQAQYATPDHPAGVTSTGKAATSVSRRRVLRQAGFALAVLAGTAVVWESVTRLAATLGRTRPALHLGDVPTQVAPPTPQYAGWQDTPGLVAEVTPTPAFYYVSKNLESDPALNAETWHLTLSGMVDRPLTLSYDELRALGSTQQYQTLGCISNEVGGDLISNARWTGVSLADLLGQASIQPGASEVIFRCADGYSDRLHLTQALNPEALVAYLINGQPLPTAHGFPARLLVPGLYGMKNGKWVTSLEVAAGNYQGYWEQRGWTQEAIIKLMARVDVPSDGDLLPRKPVMIAGIAFAGDQGVGRVEVTTNGGDTWSAARLKQPLSNVTWVLWEYPWTPEPGTHVIAVRAIDLAGRVQTPREAPPLPDGASGYHAITVTVG